MSDESPDQTNTNQWPEHAAAPNTHRRVFELVCQHMGELKGKEICDIPCGAGSFSARLASLGASVISVDLEAVEPFYYERDRRVLANANERLPLDTGRFDAVVSIEGIEHLENPAHFLRECARITRPGGFLFLSTPNVDSYRSRRSVYVHGYHKYFKPASVSHKMAYHLLPVDMTFMRGALERAGFDLVDLAVNRLSGKSWLSELMRPLFTRKLPQEMRGPVPYYGEVIIYILKKR